MAKQNALTQAQRDFAIVRLRELLLDGEYSPHHQLHRQQGFRYNETELYELAKDPRNLVKDGETKVRDHTSIHSINLNVCIERTESQSYKFKPAVVAKLDAAYEKRKALQDAKHAKFRELEAIVMLGDAAALMTVITDAQAFLKTLK